MKITLKLFATLGDYLPPGSRSNQVDIEVGDQESVAQVLGRVAVPPKLVHLVLVNGVYVAPDRRPEVRLSAGDQLAVWPPVAGG